MHGPNLLFRAWDWGAPGGRIQLPTHTKAGHEAGEVDVPRGEHVELLEAGDGSRLHQRVRVVLGDGAAHQAGRANGGNGGPGPWVERAKEEPGVSRAKSCAPGTPWFPQISPALGFPDPGQDF